MMQGELKLAPIRSVPFMPLCVPSSDEPSDRRDLLFESFDRILVVRQRSIDELLALCCHAISETTGLPDLVDALNPAHSALNLPRNENYEAQLAHANHLADVARKEINSGFANLHEMATILLWGALETAVKDFLSRWLQLHEQARTSEPLSKVRVRVNEYEAMNMEERMQFIVEQLERETGAALKIGLGRFDSLLSTVGIDVHVEDEVRKTLHEMAAVRNVLIHRAGRADGRFVNLCPWMVREGETVRVTRDAYVRYRRALGNYSAQIIRTAIEVDRTWKNAAR